MAAAWKRKGKPKAKLEEAAAAARLDPQLLDRWVKFLAKKQSYYPYLHDWQMMIAQGGTEDQAKFLGDSLQQRILDLELEQKQLDEDDEKIKAKADVPTRRTKEAKPDDID